LLDVRGTAIIPDFAILSLPNAEDNVTQEVWKIEATIPQLSYLSHNFFRYYGKFPSVLARRLIDRYSTAGDLILDNMAGCGTSLVEAMLLNRNAVGLDVNPVAVLAGRVKTNSKRYDDFRRLWSTLNTTLRASGQGSLFPSTRVNSDSYIPTQSDLTKWFSDQAVAELANVRAHIELQHDLEFADFLRLGFAAIIRRVSFAYDGEVRPHVNRSKRPRPVLAAFCEKIADMLDRLEQQQYALGNTSPSCASLLTDAREPLGGNIEAVDLVISHPPYLNCFNYIPVYRLEMLWLGLEAKAYAKDEVVSWPARGSIVDDYYNGNQLIINSALSLLRPGGRYTIVIGDCTIHGVLERTHKKFIEMGRLAGLSLESIIFRDTHYATGRYSYRHRAEYNYEAGEQIEKRDVILVFRKPQ